MPPHLQEQLLRQQPPKALLSSVSRQRFAGCKKEGAGIRLVHPFWLVPIYSCPTGVMQFVSGFLRISVLCY